MYFIADEALNGVRLGGSIEQLREIGRPASRKNRVYGYPELGLEVGVAADRVDSFTFLVGSRESVSDIGARPDFRNAQVVVRAAFGESVVLDSRSDRSLIEGILGPLEPADGGDPSGLCATRGDVYFGFEFSEAGALTIMDVERASISPA